NVGIGRADEETELFQCSDFSAQLRNDAAQVAFALGRSRFDGQFVFRAAQAVFGRREVWIWAVRLLWPLEAGKRFEVRWRAGAARHPVAIGTICIDVHVCLEQEGFAMGLWMPQLKHRLAIVKIVPGK